jgi:hypothetical protein
MEWTQTPPLANISHSTAYRPVLDVMAAIVAMGAMAAMAMMGAMASVLRSVDI